MLRINKGNNKTIKASLMKAQTFHLPLGVSVRLASIVFYYFTSKPMFNFNQEEVNDLMSANKQRNKAGREYFTVDDMNKNIPNLY